MQSASDTPSSHSRRGWRSPTAPVGGARGGAAARSGANRGLKVVAERQAKRGTGMSRSHPEHGNTQDKLTPTGAETGMPSAVMAWSAATRIWTSAT